MPERQPDAESTRALTPAATPIAATTFRDRLPARQGRADRRNLPGRRDQPVLEQ
jgi:hypothetical protein